MNDAHRFVVLCYMKDTWTQWILPGNAKNVTSKQEAVRTLFPWVLVASEYNVVICKIGYGGVSVKLMFLILVNSSLNPNDSVRP